MLPSKWQVSLNSRGAFLILRQVARRTSCVLFQHTSTPLCDKFLSHHDRMYSSCTCHDDGTVVSNWAPESCRQNPMTAHAAPSGSYELLLILENVVFIAVVQNNRLNQQQIEPWNYTFSIYRSNLMQTPGMCGSNSISSFLIMVRGYFFFSFHMILSEVIEMAASGTTSGKHVTDMTFPFQCMSWNWWEISAVESYHSVILPIIQHCQNTC